jgi:site-specific recombinase XerC
LELSAVRGLFQFALDMNASDVMFNPAKNVRVKKPKSVLPEDQEKSRRTNFEQAEAAEKTPKG